MPDTVSVLERIIFKHTGKPQDPCAVIFCGVHGNEKAGIYAMERVLKKLDHAAFRGSLFVIRGNIPALKQDSRFVDADLNRLWTRERLLGMPGLNGTYSEDRDQREIYALIREIENFVTGPLYFIDIHTTSAASVPFITIDDSLINRRFTALFPVPVVLGIEEYLKGAMLSFINQEGFVSLGFEAGEHHSEIAVDSAESFIYLALNGAGLVCWPEKMMKRHYQRLKDIAGADAHFYEVTFRKGITGKDDFKMAPGFRNFQRVAANTHLGILNGKELETPKKVRIFMPLYQQQGEDAYFFVRRLPRWVLRCSALLRLLKLDGFFVLLPGVRWIDSHKKGLRIDLRVARFLTKSVFHLFGYREWQKDEGSLYVYNRERNPEKSRYPFFYELSSCEES